MREIEIALPRTVAPAKVVRAIDAAIQEHALTVTLRATLRSFAGCTHWHVKEGRAAGTLEITLWPAEHRAWFSIQKGRKAPWIAKRVTQLRESIHKRLGEGQGA